jgi:acyl carrier protein
MYKHVEPRIRRLVAEQLGVDPHELAPEVSLTDELAADSLDLIELALVLEQELTISIPEAVMSETRTYGDLVAVVDAIMRTSRDTARDRRTAAPRVWASIVREHDQLHRAEWLTPYTVQTITEDALHSGAGTRLDLEVPSSVTDASLARLEHQFAWLRDRGVVLSVHREQRLGPKRQGPRPPATSSGRTATAR